MLSTGDIIKIVVAFLMPENVVAQLVTHYIVESGGDIDEQDTLDEIDTALGVAWAHIDQIVNIGVESDTISLSLWDSVLGQFDEVASKATSLFDGSGGTDMLPHGNAAVVRFFTNVGRRQGRKFIPGILELQQVDGNLIPGAITALALFAADWDDVVTVDTTDLTMGVFDAVADDFQAFVQSVAANTIVGYQRRRKSGVGI